MTSHEIIQYIGTVASTAVADIVLVAVALRTLPAKLAERFFGYAFDKGIARLKHDQDTALAHVQARLSHVGDRGSRSNEREYEAVIASWEVFIDAYDATMLCTGGLYERPDLDRMSREAVEQVLKAADYSEQEVRYVADATDRNHALSHVERLRETRAARSKVWIARDVLSRKSVFIPDPLLKDFEDALARLSEVCNEQRWAYDQNGRAYPGRDFSRTTALAINGEEEVRRKLANAIRKQVLHVDEGSRLHQFSSSTN